MVENNLTSLKTRIHKEVTTITSLGFEQRWSWKKAAHRRISDPKNETSKLDVLIQQRDSKDDNDSPTMVGLDA